MQALLVALDLQKYWPPRPVIHSAVFIWVRHGIGVERPADRGLRRQLLPPLQTQGLKIRGAHIGGVLLEAYS